MKYKLVAVDMDGTLLNDENIVTNLTRQKIKEIKELGVIFTISTGRPFQGVAKYQQLLDITHPIITYNGAMIVHPQTNEILYEQGLNSEDARKIIELGISFDTTMCIWSDNKLYGNKLNDKIHEYKKMSGVEPILMSDVDALLEQGITKILWYDEIININSYQQELMNETFDEVTYCTSKPIFLEFFNSSVSKAKAIERLGDIYELNMSEIITIGDASNDVSMIEYAGLGIAMENACTEVKQVANYITKSNNDDGIAYALDKFIIQPAGK